jgi:hypothetical protein
MQVRGARLILQFTIKLRADCVWRRFCHLGFTSRCINSQLIGSQVLPGAQAQYVRVPKAGGTLFHAPSVSAKDGEQIADSSLLLLADILPTGYFAALQALNHQNMRPYLDGDVFLNGEASGAVSATQGPTETLCIAILGLGPVGLVRWLAQTTKIITPDAEKCALVSLLDILGSRIISIPFYIIAIDPNPGRRSKAQKMLARLGVGTESAVVVSTDEAKSALFNSSAPRGCHAVLEVFHNYLQAPFSLYRLHSLSGCWQ